MIKGSGAINFGPQTMGGVINYFTRRPRNEFGGSLKMTAGENGFVSLFAEVGGSKNQKAQARNTAFVQKRGWIQAK